MEQRRGCGEVAAKRCDLFPSGADAGEDRLSALPDDVLVLILLRLLDITAIVRTSVLSRRWRHIWTLLPELLFLSAPDEHHISEVLAATEAPALRKILVFTRNDTPDSVAAWLPLAARRLSGVLRYYRCVDADEEVDGAVPLPCFDNATVIDLDLGFFALSLPSSGAFARLTELCLERVRFQGTCELGDVISSPRCPALRKLKIRHARGLTKITVHSLSLLQMDMWYLCGFQQLKIDAPALNELTLCSCFVRNQPIADISAPLLASLNWRDAYDPSSVRLGNLGQLQQLGTYFFMVYGNHGDWPNRDILQLLQRFQLIHTLTIALSYVQEIHQFQYLMEDIKALPNVVFLKMLVINERHTFSASLFHVLRLCTGIRSLLLILHSNRDLEALSTCPSGCICDQPPDWRNQELSLNCLQEVKIICLKGAEHEVAFLKQLFNWVVVLEKLKITFDYSVSKSKAKELCHRLSSFSRQETRAQFYIYKSLHRTSEDLLLLGDEGTGV